MLYTSYTQTYTQTEPEGSSGYASLYPTDAQALRSYTQ